MKTGYRQLGQVGLNYLYECHVCAAVVNSVIEHDEWHARLEAVVRLLDHAGVPDQGVDDGEI